MFFSAGGPGGARPRRGSWRTEGTQATTLQLTDPAANLVIVGGALLPDARLVFGGRDWIWISDGTPAGTLELTNLGLLISDAFVAAGQRVYYTTRQNGLDETPFLWSTDGSAAGTLPLGPVGTKFGAPPLGRGLGRLFFSRATAEVGLEL